MREATRMMESLERKEQVRDVLTWEKLPWGGRGTPEETWDTSEAARRMGASWEEQAEKALEQETGREPQLSEH